MANIFQSSAFELAALIRNKQFTSEQLVKAHIERIRSVNEQLNAVIENRFEAALAQAKSIDQQNQAGSIDWKTKPLSGVPFTLKEMIAVKGFKSTMGSIHQKDHVSEQNATVTERLLGTGAILLGTTNVPEVGLWFECDNPIYGETKNPHNSRRTSGGSSGGEGAVIGGGGSPFGVGSDIGGSIRIPAAFCGIYGHKSSEKIVPLTGHEPVFFNGEKCVGDLYPMTVLGPMARRVEDLYPLLQILSGPDGVDLETRKDFVLKPKVTDWRGKKVLFLPSPNFKVAKKVDKKIADKVRQAADYFRGLGADVEELDRNIFAKMFEMWTARALLAEDEKFSMAVSGGQGLNYFKEFSRLLFGQRRYTFPILLTALVDDVLGKKVPIEKLNAELTKLRDQLSEKLGEDGILLMPVHSRTAPKLGATIFTPFDFIYTGAINALAYPATSVPCGIEQDTGLPYAIQIASRQYSDHACLSAAEVLAGRL